MGSEPNAPSALLRKFNGCVIPIDIDFGEHWKRHAVVELVRVKD